MRVNNRERKKERSILLKKELSSKFSIFLERERERGGRERERERERKRERERTILENYSKCKFLINFL